LKHEDTKPSQSHVREETADNADRRRYCQGRRERAVEIQHRRGSGRRTTAGNRRAGERFRSQAIVTVPLPSGLRFESAGLATFLYSTVERTSPPPEQRKSEAEPTRPGASAGGKPFCDERSRSEQKGFPPAGGDRMIADSSAVNPRYGRFGAARSSACICVICGFLVWADGLRVFVSSCLRRAMVGDSAPPRLRASALYSSVFPVCNCVSSPRLIGS